jgi:pimeloyl-ACP methyl ester carboxylesterase
MTETTSQSRYFELLGRAYEVPLESEGFESFLDAAHDFFCVDPETGRVSDDISAFSEAASDLEHHTRRLGRIFDVAIRAESAGGTDARYHALLTLEPGSDRVHGNGAAVELLDCELPCRLSELPLDHAALNQIRACLLGKQSGELIVLATVERDEPQPCLALVQPSGITGGEARISLSFVHWSGALIARLGRALGLTESETEVLQGHLENKTPRQIAEDRQRSPETIKAQAKTILRKTGCTRMTDVVGLAASIAYLLRKMPDPSAPDLDDWTTPVRNLQHLVREGRKVAYYMHGAGRTAVLFSHALIQGPFFAPAFLTRLQKAGVRLVAPSRPGFGYTSPPGTEHAFKETAVTDALAVLDAEGIGNVHIIGHQLGTSHAFRIAAALGHRARSLILINGGIPLEERHYASMDRRVRFAALATRHAPAILKLSNALGIRSFRKKGVRAFLIDRYTKSDCDMQALAKPGVLELHAQGTFHACEQGGIPFYLDEKSKHSDWHSDVLAVECPQFWLQPAQCSILDPDAVRSFVEGLRGARIETEPGAGAIMLYERPERVADFILSAIADAQGGQAGEP